MDRVYIGHSVCIMSLFIDLVESHGSRRLPHSLSRILGASQNLGIYPHFGTLGSKWKKNLLRNMMLAYLIRIVESTVRNAGISGAGEAGHL